MYTTQSKIINFLNRYWNSNNVWFGLIIHELKPKNKSEWVKFLETKSFYFLKNMRAYGFKTYEHKYWMYYLINSFWKLYTSETAAIDFFNQQGIELIFANRYLDATYGIDFTFFLNNSQHHLIVKHKVYDLDQLLSFKQFPNFKNVILFDSGNSKTYHLNQSIKQFEQVALVDISVTQLQSKSFVKVIG